MTLLYPACYKSTNKLITSQSYRMHEFRILSIIRPIPMYCLTNPYFIPVNYWVTSVFCLSTAIIKNIMVEYSRMTEEKLVVSFFKPT